MWRDIEVYVLIWLIFDDDLYIYMPFSENYYGDDEQ